MPGLTRIRTFAIALLFVATVSAAAMTSISGQEEETTLPTISISATGGTTSVEEGQDASFTITMNPAATDDVEILVVITAIGEFTDIPTETDEYLTNPKRIKTVVIATGDTQAELVIPTIDDSVDEDDGSIRPTLSNSPVATVDPARRYAKVQILDNDPTVPPGKMAPPTVLPADGRLEVFWEEPVHTGEREIDRYRVTWSGPSFSGVATYIGYERHRSIIGTRNGGNYTVRIQACKEVVTYCGEYSDTVSATPTASGPTMTGPESVSLPEEAEGTVGQFTATPSPGGTIVWRLGGNDAEFFSPTVNSDGSMTLKLNAGTNFEDPGDRNRDNVFQVTVVATDNAPGLSSNVTETAVTVTDVDETPVFDPDSITKGPYVAGQPIESFLLPAPKADEVPVAYVTTGLPPRLSRFGTRLILGTPSEAGTFNSTHRATDVDGDSGSLSIEFTVVPAGERLEIKRYPETLSVGGAGQTILLKGVNLDPDITYGVTGHLTSDKARFDAECTLQTQQEEIETFPFGDRVQSFTVYGCQAGLDTFTATLIKNGAPVDTVTTAITVSASLDPPTGLDVIPLPANTGTHEREALLTWQASANETADTVYDIYIQADGDIAPTMPVATITGDPLQYQLCLDDTVLTPQTTAMHNCEHDNTSPNKGLAEFDHLDIWIQARESTTTPSILPSTPSQRTRIVPSQIIRIDGNAKEKDGTRQVPQIHWVRVPSTTAVTFRWRRLHNDATGHAHSSPNWQADYTALYNAEPTSSDPFPNPADSWTTVDPELPAMSGTQPTESTTELAGMTLGIPHAIQMTHTHTDSDGDTTKVFAATFDYVIPSEGTIDGGDRVTAIPLRRFHPQKTYSYVLCEATFDEPRETWNRLVEHAVTEWVRASGNLITAGHLVLDEERAICPDYNAFIDDVLAEVNSYLDAGGYSFTRPSDFLMRELIEMALEALRDHNIRSTSNEDKNRNEITMINDSRYRNTLPVGAFTEIAKKANLAKDCLEEADFSACTTFTYRGFSGLLATSDENEATVDIDIFRSKIQPLPTMQLSASHFPGTDLKWDAEDTMFNRCADSAFIPVEGPPTHAYKTLIHEIGHALGLHHGGDGNSADGSRDHPNEHLIESVMRHTHDKSPGCSPHPFDVMALHAIYQTVE